MALNISDFSRHAKTQKDQAVGQALGLTGFMTLFSIVAVAVTTVASGAESVVGDFRNTNASSTSATVARLRRSPRLKSSPRSA